MNEILNQLLNDVEKHGITLVRDHLQYYEKQLNEVKSQSILKDFPQRQNQTLAYVPIFGQPTKTY